MEANIDNLIALIHILDNYSGFINNLAEFISSKYNRDEFWRLYEISHGELVLGARKAKRFYQENKHVIDTINAYSNISNFINFDYNWQEKISEDSSFSLNFFYQYFLCNKNELGQIVSVLAKLKELGFDRLKFDAGKEFTQDEYTMDTSFSRNFCITYLDNMQVIPNYQNSIVKYKTTGSSYAILITVSAGQLCKYVRTVTLNSLVFDAKRLPEALTKECIFDKLIELKEEQRESCNTIRNSVDLSICIADLRNQFMFTNGIIEKLVNMEKHKELREVLVNIREYIDKLQSMSEEYDVSVSKEDSSITKERLQEERKLYLDRRRLERLDDD